MTQGNEAARKTRVHSTSDVYSGIQVGVDTSFDTAARPHKVKREVEGPTKRR
jgi:hypothetical protein